MKFVHIADVHLDRPFTKLSDRGNLGDLKRIEQKKIFKEVIEYIKKTEVDCLFIAGDLYEHRYIQESTIEYINKLFKEIPNTKIFITPGNHDPLLKNSYYKKFNWNENVIIFSSDFECFEMEDTDIYGFGFSDFYQEGIDINSINIKNQQKNNILIMHGNLDGAQKDEREYNPIKKYELEEKEFEYIALGHIHKTNFNKDNKIIYPGSLVPLGFDEIGKHGMVVGEIEAKKVKIDFIELQSSKFEEQNINIDEIYSMDELAQELQEMKIEDNRFIKINIIGNRNFEIDLYKLYKLIENDRIIKIKDLTKRSYDLNNMERENTLKGLFVKKMNDRLKNKDITEEEKDIIERAIEIGLEALK